MEKQFLFENEQSVITSGDGSVMLTTRRIQQTSSSFGKEHITSMHLENISSIEVHHRSWLATLLLGIVCIAGALLVGVQGNSAALGAGFLIGCICIIVYFITRRYVITISSNGGAKINILIKGMARHDVLDFVNKIETAKSLVK